MLHVTATAKEQYSSMKGSLAKHQNYRMTMTKRSRTSMQLVLIEVPTRSVNLAACLCSNKMHNTFSDEEWSRTIVTLLKVSCVLPSSPVCPFAITERTSLTWAATGDALLESWIDQRQNAHDCFRFGRLGFPLPQRKRDGFHSATRRWS